MATLYISEFSGLGFTGGFGVQKIQAPSAQGLKAFQTVSLSGSTNTSNPLNATTTLVKLISDTNCFLNYGNSGVTAASGDDYLPAGVVYWLAINPGSYIAAIT